MRFKMTLVTIITLIYYLIVNYFLQKSSIFDYILTIIIACILIIDNDRDINKHMLDISTAIFILILAVSSH